jgi:hypothetical protein
MALLLALGCGSLVETVPDGGGGGTTDAGLSCLAIDPCTQCLACTDVGQCAPGLSCSSVSSCGGKRVCQAG